MSHASAAGEPSQPWSELAADYERARALDDSLDTLVEWPAQRELLGDVAGRTVLDLGCGNGGKLAELLELGAARAVGVDISGNFIGALHPGLHLLRADLNDLESIGELKDTTFDRVMFLQSFGYADDPVKVLSQAREMLSDDGFIVLSRTQPLRYALERAEQHGTSLGDEYFATAPYTYRSAWNEQIALTKRTFTMSDLLNSFSAAGLYIESVVEPQMSDTDRQRYPLKQIWMGKYLGILVFKLRPR